MAAIAPAPPPFVLLDPSGNPWTVTINGTGQLVTTAGGTPQGVGYSPIMTDADGNTWMLQVSTGGILSILGYSDSAVGAEGNILVPDPNGFMWRIGVNGSGQLITNGYGGAATPITMGDVNDRVRSICNDNSGQLYPDGSPALLNAVRDAYSWVCGQISKLSGSTFENVAEDVPYVPASSPGVPQNLATILPADFWRPLSVEFRCNAGEYYVPLDRVTKLPSTESRCTWRPFNWQLRGQSIWVNSGGNAGLMKFTYISTFPVPSLTTDPIAITNCTEAVAHYAAAELFRARGQYPQMTYAMGDDGSRNGGVGSGAKGFLAALLDNIVQDEQSVPRRGAGYSDGAIGGITNQPYNQ